MDTYDQCPPYVNRYCRSVAIDVVRTSHAPTLGVFGPRRARLGACLALALPLTGFAADPLPATGGGVAAASAPALQAHDVVRRVTATSRLLYRPRLLEHIATTRLVSNCNDNGLGSLRAAANIAVDGDLIDMTSLACSLISLTTGQINLTAANVTLAGPAGRTLTVTAGALSRHIAHTGHGTLGIYDLRLNYGFNLSPGNSNGGCVYSSGSIVFERSHAHNCVAIGEGVKTAGGALFAQGYVLLNHSQIDRSYARADAGAGAGAGGGVYAGLDVYLLDSSVTDSGVTGPVGNFANGGGIYAGGNAIIDRSTISHCYAGQAPSFATPSYGGGVWVNGGASAARGTQVTRSTISHNQARGAAGMQLAGSSSTPYNVIISDSTISGNVAAKNFGGIATERPTVVSNSTIAFNNAGATDAVAGLNLFLASIDLQSSIIANNYAPGARKDFASLGGTVTGSNNLITVSSGAPADTLTADPQLNALANNGGPTQTHSLKITSPAINHGNNGANLAYDQRGPTFPRVIGSVDIGAVEFNTDFIFANGFNFGP